MIDSELLNFRIFLVWGNLKIFQEEHLLLILCSKLIFWKYKIKDLSEKKLLKRIVTDYYPEPDSHIRN